MKTNFKKLDCAFCVSGKMMFGCSICKGAPCKTLKDKSHKNENCFMILHKHVDLIKEHHKIRHAYSGTRISTDGTSGIINSSSNYEDQEAIMEQEGDNDGEDSVGAGVPNTESEYLPKWQLRTAARRRYSEEEKNDNSTIGINPEAEEEENDNSTTGINPEADYRSTVLSRI
jgi:hypothetical protein